MLTKKKPAHAGLWMAVVLPLLFLAGCSPSGPDALLDGKRLLDRGQPAAAVRKLRDATVLMPTNALAWGYLGLAYQQSGSASNAIIAYTRAIAHGPNSAEVRFNLGCLWMEQGQWANAREQFAAATVLDRKAAHAWRRLGEAQLRMGDSAEAVRSLGESLRLEVGNADAWNWLGLAQLQLGRPQEAERSFQSAMRVQANHGPAILNLAILNQQQLKNPGKAVELYRQYLAFFPNAANAADVMRVVESLANTPKAPVALVEEAEKGTPAPEPQQPEANPVKSNQTAEKIIVQSNLVTRTVPVEPPQTSSPPAVIRSEPSRQPPAKEVAVTPQPRVVTSSRVDRLEPNPIPTASSRTVVAEPEPENAPGADPPIPPKKRGFLAKLNPLNLFKKGDSGKMPTPLPDRSTNSRAPVSLSEQKAVGVTFVKAGGPLKQVKVANADRFQRYPYPLRNTPPPGDRKAAELAYGDAEALRRRGRKEEAVQAYLQVVRTDPTLFAAQFNLGLLSLELRDLPRALAAFETATVLEPDSVPARYNFALALKAANYPVDAANELLKLLSLDPGDASAHLILGNLYAQQFGDKSNAREEYMKVLELNPGHPQASSIGFWLVENPL